MSEAAKITKDYFFREGAHTRAYLAAQKAALNGSWLTSYAAWLNNTYPHVKGNTAFVPSITDLYGIDAEPTQYNASMDVFKKYIELLPKGAINHMHFFAVLRPKETLKTIRDNSTSIFEKFDEWVKKTRDFGLDKSQISAIEKIPKTYLNWGPRRVNDLKMPKVNKDLLKKIPGGIYIDLNQQAGNQRLKEIEFKDKFDFRGYFVSKPPLQPTG